MRSHFAFDASDYRAVKSPNTCQTTLRRVLSAKVCFCQTATKAQVTSRPGADPKPSHSTQFSILGHSHLEVSVNAASQKFVCPWARTLRQQRTMSGLNQSEASRNPGISNSTLCLFERSFIALKPSHLVRLPLDVADLEKFVRRMKTRREH